MRLAWADQMRRFTHREPWRGLQELSVARRPETAGRLEWLLWHSHFYGLSVEACDADDPPHLAIEVAAAYDVTTPAASVDALRERAVSCAHLAFDELGADLGRAYASNHFKVRPSMRVREYLAAAADLPSLVTLVRDDS